MVFRFWKQLCIFESIFISAFFLQFIELNIFLWLKFWTCRETSIFSFITTRSVSQWCERQNHPLKNGPYVYLSIYLSSSQDQREFFFVLDWVKSYLKKNHLHIWPKWLWFDYIKRKMFFSRFGKFVVYIIDWHFFSLSSWKLKLFAKSKTLIITKYWSQKIVKKLRLGYAWK